MATRSELEQNVPIRNLFLTYCFLKFLIEHLKSRKVGHIQYGGNTGFARLSKFIHIRIQLTSLYDGRNGYGACI